MMADNDSAETNSAFSGGKSFSETGNRTKAEAHPEGENEDQDEKKSESGTVGRGDAGGDLVTWLRHYTNDLLQAVVVDLTKLGLLTDDADTESKTLDLNSVDSQQVFHEEIRPRHSGTIDESSIPFNPADENATRPESEPCSLTFTALPSVVTWTIHSAPVESQLRLFGNLPSVVTWLQVPRRGFTALPSVVTWIQGRHANDAGSSSTPQRVTRVDAFESTENSQIDALIDSEEVADGIKIQIEETVIHDDAFEEPDPDRLTVVLDEREEIQLLQELAESPRLRLSQDDAALRLQRTCRGMLDRKFFRKYRAKAARQVQTQTLRPSAMLDSLKSFNVKLPMIETDGYLSKTTVKKLQSRGEPLALTKVEEKFNQIKTKPHVSFQIQPPGKEEETWHIGESKSIKWKTVGNIEIVKVGLYLYRDGEPIHTIIKAVPNGGKYIFVLPENMAAGEDTFQVLVIAEQPKLPHVHAFTPPFSVRERKVGMLARVPTAIPKLIGTFPSRPGWSWIAGDTQMISWTSEGVVQNVSVDILRHGVLAMRLSGSCLNVGAFQFPMPLDAPLGEGFQIRVRCTTNRAAFCLSYPFAIIDRQVALAVPRRAPKASRRQLQASDSLPDLSQSRCLKPIAPASPSETQELPFGSEYAASNLPNGRLRAPALSPSLSKSLPNAHGLSGISFDSSVPSPPRHPDFEARPEPATDSAHRGSRSGRGHGPFSSPYFAARSGTGRRRAEVAEAPRERPAASVAEANMERWVGTDMERFTAKGERALQERVSTGRLMASALSPMENARARAATDKPGAKSAGKLRRRGREESLSSTVGGRRGVERSRIISGAEQFLEMRDQMLAEQMQTLRASFADPHPLPGTDPQPGPRYLPALLPELLDAARRPGAQSAPPAADDLNRPDTGGGQWKRYERARIRDGTPSTAVTEYVDAVQHRIYHMRVGPPT